MPLLKKHVIEHGTFFKSHYCSTAVCCPSRVTLWTGRNAHNTNVTDVFPPYGSRYTPDVWAELMDKQVAIPNS
jgi:N-acetylglucosamine-6-sulfatase